MTKQEIGQIITGISLLWLLPMSYHWTKHIIEEERKKRKCFLCKEDCYAKNILIKLSEKNDK